MVEEKENFVPDSFKGNDDPFAYLVLWPPSVYSLSNLQDELLLELVGEDDGASSTPKVLRVLFFGNQVTSEEDLAKLCKGFVPKSIAESMQVALCNFESWWLWC